MNQTKRGFGGFTLIEVLIVIAIIGLLASIILIGYGTFRVRGRDTRRIADLTEVQKALELYYLKFQQYPPSATWDSLKTVLTDPKNGLSISTIPNDPLNDPTNPSSPTYKYGVKTAPPPPNQGYVLEADLEDINNSALQNSSHSIPFSINTSIRCDQGTVYYCVIFQ